ncbi:MAG: riboflavin synthase, partial [bacterium]
VVERGSVALSGVSLTVASLAGDRVEVSLIPETLERTNLGFLGEGDKINLECDLVARHVRRLLESVQP